MPFKPVFGVYRIRNTANNKAYIGSGNIPSRLAEHRRYLNRNDHANIKLQRAWNKHGKESFVFEILEYCERASCTEIEQLFMDEHQAATKGYNLRPNAQNNLGHKWTPEARAKQSQSPITKAKISAALRGRSPSEETRKKLSLASLTRRDEISAQTTRLFKGIPKSPAHRNKLATLNREKALSPEFREKIAASKRGKKRAPFSAEWRAKMSLAHLGKKRGPRPSHPE